MVRNFAIQIDQQCERLIFTASHISPHDLSIIIYLTITNIVKFSAAYQRNARNAPKMCFLQEFTSFKTNSSLKLVQYSKLSR